LHRGSCQGTPPNAANQAITTADQQDDNTDASNEAAYNATQATDLAALQSAQAADQSQDDKTVAADQTQHDANVATDLNTFNTTVNADEAQMGQAASTQASQLQSETASAASHDVRGILGMDFLRKYVVRLDCDAGELSFLSSSDSDGMKLLLVPRGDGRAMLIADITGHGPERFLVASAYVSTISGCIKTSLFKELVDSGIGRDQTGMWRANLPSGTGKQAAMRIRGIEIGDYKHGNLEFGEYADGNLLTLNYLSRSPAARSGVHSGDHLLRVGSLDCDTTRMYVLRQALAHAEDGAMIQIRRGERLFTAELK
jgi:hypothetical protein